MSLNSTINARELAIGYLTGSRKPIPIHEGLSFELFAGELTCLLGPNGAGKSTLLRTLAGLQKRLGGEVTLLGQPAQHFSHEALSRTLAIVLTERIPAAGLKVSEVVALGRQPYTGFFGGLETEDYQKIGEAMEKTAISHLAQKRMADLSDGERQKTMIAKALTQECPIIILDEPTAFLDLPSRFDMMSLLHSLARDSGKSILLSTHDLESALLLGDRLWLLSAGKPLTTGTPEDLILSGLFGACFENENLRFDKSVGTFRFMRNEWTPIRLLGDGPLKHWISNALVRNGYRPRADEGQFTVEAYSLPEPRIRLTAPGFKAEPASVEALLNTLHALQTGKGVTTTSPAKYPDGGADFHSSGKV